MKDSLQKFPWNAMVHVCAHVYKHSTSFLSTKGPRVGKQPLSVGGLAGCALYLPLTSLIPSSSCQQFSNHVKHYCLITAWVPQHVSAYTALVEARGKMSKPVNDTTPTLSRAGLGILSLTFSKQGCGFEAKCYCKTCLAIAACWISPLLCIAQLLPGGLKSLILERDSWAKESLQASRKKVLVLSPHLLISTHTHPSLGLLVSHS